MTSREQTMSIDSSDGVFENKYAMLAAARRVGLYLVLGAILFVVLFPIFWAFSSALRSGNSLFTIPAPLFPPEITLTHFQTVIFEMDFPRYYLNSIILALGVVSVTTTAATLGGYGLTRIDIPYKKTFARSVLIGYMFPPILLAIPMFILFREFGIINSYIGLILGVTATALPFSLWLMWKFFQTVPLSLEESARMAGASRFRAFYEIALPMAKPGVIAVALFSYAVAWNAYTLPIIIMQDRRLWPITVGLSAFTEQQSVQWGPLMAGIVLTLIPPLLFVYFLQKYLLEGFEVGG